MVAWTTSRDAEWTSPPSLRRIIIDLVEEYARHVGHADLIREALAARRGGPAVTPSHVRSASTAPI